MRYIYFGENKGGNHKGITCVGYTADEDRTVEMSFSFCSPEDRFSRKKAHAIINGRMKKGNKVTSVFAGAKYVKYEEILDSAKDLLNQVKNDDKVGGVAIPSWFKGV